MQFPGTRGGRSFDSGAVTGVDKNGAHAHDRQNRSGVLPASAWEAAKAGRRSLSHAEAVRESARITSIQCTLMKKKVSPDVALTKIVRALNEKRIPFVLTGAHAIGGYTGRPRATKDVDILVKSGRNHARAVKAIRELYPALEVRKFGGVTAFFVPGETDAVIDVIYPHRADIEETLAHPVLVKAGGLEYRIPTLEAALANKYGAMLTSSRDVKKRLQDALDFSWMVAHSTDKDQESIDLGRLEALGEKVWPEGGGDEILRLVEQVKQGGIVDLVALLKNGRNA